jgi:hypothetical protein
VITQVTRLIATVDGVEVVFCLSFFSDFGAEKKEPVKNTAAQEEGRNVQHNSNQNFHYYSTCEIRLPHPTGILIPVTRYFVRGL